MKLSGYHVSVYSDGEKLNEYSTDGSSDGKKITCWIPSQGGKEFVVRYRDGKSSTIGGRSKSVHIYTDGHRMRKYALFPHDTRGKATGVRVSENAERPFTFADIRTTDEDTGPGGARVRPDEIGTISVRVFLVESWQRQSSAPRYKIRDHPPALVDERTKKAGQHCISLGDERPCRTGTNGHHADYDSQKPDLVFEFRYRPMDMLRASGIIPPPKRESPLVIDLEDEDTQPPPKRRKTTHSGDPVQSMQAELERLRRRVDELEGDEAGPSGVKKEAIKYDPADIIDLT